ncbi:MAG TPA: hypothetical protein VKZ59_09510 [Acidobacteriota bacterium]|nr:hypothetical protein [Acidobacteriota bacterium]
MEIAWTTPPSSQYNHDVSYRSFKPTDREPSLRRRWFPVPSAILPFGTRLYLLLLLLIAACSSGPPSSTEEDTTETNPSQEIALEFDWAPLPLSYSVTELQGYAYLGLGDELVILDVGDPAEPTEIGSITLAAPVRDILVSDKLAFVAGGPSGLHIVDVTSPDKPRLLSNIPTEDGCEAVAYSSPYLYTAARTAGLLVFDVSMPQRPRQLSSLPILEEAMDVKTKDSLALVAASFGGLRLVDVSDPKEPREIGFATRGSYDQGYAWSVAVQNDLAYVANVEIGLRSVDISNPSEAKTEGLYGLATYVDRPYAPVSVAVEGRYAYLADQAAGLRIVDVSDPEEMEEISQIDIPGWAMDVEIAGNRAFVASKSGGLRIIDISEPIRPVEIGFYDPSVVAKDVHIADGRCFLVDSNRLIRTVDISDLRQPRQVDGHPSNASAIVAGKEHLYVADSDGIKIIRTPSPQRMAEVASFSFPSVKSLSLEGNFLHALNDAGVVLRVDVTRPEEPQIQGEIDTVSLSKDQGIMSGTSFSLGEAETHYMDDSRLYVAVGNRLLTFDINDWKKPVFTGEATFHGRAWSMWSKETNLLLLTDTGLFLFEASESGAPIPAASSRTRAIAGTVHSERNELWIVEITGRVRGFHFDNGGILEEIGLIDLPCRITGVSYWQEKLFLAAGENGLQVLDISDPTSPRLTGGWTSTRNSRLRDADGNEMASPHFSRGFPKQVK